MTHIEDMACSLIRGALQSQTFVDWYQSDFENWICGHDPAPTTEQIEKRIRELFSLHSLSQEFDHDPPVPKFEAFDWFTQMSAFLQGQTKTYCIDHLIDICESWGRPASCGRIIDCLNKAHPGLGMGMSIRVLEWAEQTQAKNS